MLPAVIEREIFNADCDVSDIVLIHICEEIEDYGFVVTAYISDGDCIRIDFNRDAPDIVGELFIHRSSKQYEIITKYDGWVVLPVRGDWNTITKYLVGLCQ